MKYRIEIWQWHIMVDVYYNDDIGSILEWYRDEMWKSCYDRGCCTFYVYENGEELTFEELYELGFYN